MTAAAQIVALIADLDPADAPAVLVALAARMAQLRQLPQPAEPDELLTVAEVAQRLGKSKSWVYHQGRDLPFHVNGIGVAPRFSRKGLEKYIAKRSG